MGSENSKSSSRSNDDYNQILLQRAIEEQRKLYDQRYAELIDNQIRINEESMQQNQSSINRNSVSNPRPATSNTLYPNLQTVTNNNLQGAGSNSPNIVQPSTSSIRPQSSPVSPATAPVILPNGNNNLNVGQSSASSIRPQSPLSPAIKPANAVILPSAPSVSSNDRNVEKEKRIRPKRRYGKTIKTSNMQIGVECVTCKNDFGEHIYQCSDGHSSCSHCKFMSKRCGICSKIITDIRNITLEGTIADINIKMNPNERIKCRNAKDGCTLSFNKNDMENHLSECLFKDMECPLMSIFQNCSWRGKINQIVNHFKDMHPEHCVADVDSEMNLIIKENQQIVYLVAMGSFIFLINIKVNLSEKMIYMVAQLLGTKVSASKWTYELHVYNKRDPRRKFQYIDTCHSDVTQVTDIFNNFQCAAFSTDYAQTYANSGCLTYKFYLKKNIGPRRNC